MYLNELFKDAPNILIEQLSCDSRLPMKNCIFFCMTGVKYDGHDYINEAVKNGANVIVYTNDIETDLNVVYIKVKDINATLANIAKKFYKINFENFKLNVVCGCYGKSCVTSYIKQLLNGIEKSSTIGSYGINYDDKNLSYPSSTLTLLDNYRYISDIYHSDIKSCSLETDSISLSYNRLEGINPKTFVYTNTSKFSKEYKGFSYKYFDSIKKYLYTLENTTSIVLNKDDESYDILLQACGENVVTYGQDLNCTFRISNPKYYIDHTSFSLTYKNESHIINTSLIGLANIYYLTAAIATLIQSNYSLDDLIKNVETIKAPEGIYENLNIDNYNIIIDYCYAQDSYFQISEYAKKLKGYNKKYFILPIDYGTSKDEITIIFNQLKDISFLTIFTEGMSYDTDIHDLLEIGAECANGYNYLTIESRSEAIKTALDLLDKNDILFILGKGNSNVFYKNFNKEVYLGDKGTVIEYLKNR